MAFNSLIQSTFDKLVETIETGKPGSWRKSWRCGMPVNATTSRRYRGINTLMLLIEQSQREYPTAEWATYKQWASIGAQVQKGEISTNITMYKKIETERDGETASYPMMRMYNVFNAAQVTGYEPAATIGARALPMTTIEAWLESSGIKPDILKGGPCYIPSIHKIYMPDMADFHTVDDYYSTLLHEVTHYTGHHTLCNRTMLSMSADRHAYAREELVAELGAAFFCAHFGIDDNSQASYLHSWLKQTGNPNKGEALFEAARAASKAFDLLLPETVAAAEAVAA